jgi:S1-C subfamily serine protease
MTVALFLAGLMLHASPTHAQGAAYAEIDGWKVTYSETGNANFCDAVAEFQDRTLFALRLFQTESSKIWVMFISNPQWDSWVSRSSQVKVWLVTTREWQDTFGIAEDKRTMFMQDLSIDFVNSIAEASSISILSDDRRQLARLSLKNSAATIRAVVRCVQEHPLAKPTPAPPPQETTFTGTGFFVAPNMLVTNNHVVKECTSPILVSYPNRASYAAMILGQDDTNDLALLNTDMSSLAVASFRIWPRVGEPVAAFGFPYLDLLSPMGNFTLGYISSLSGLRDDTRFLQMSTPIQSGNSGGPLLDMSGNVVGVVTSQLNALGVMQYKGSVPQNINFAIHAHNVIGFLSTKGITPKVDSSAAPRNLSGPDVADIARQFTVLILCKGSEKQ